MKEVSKLLRKIKINLYRVESLYKVNDDAEAIGQVDP